MSQFYNLEIKPKLGRYGQDRYPVEQFSRFGLELLQTALVSSGVHSTAEHSMERIDDTRRSMSIFQLLWNYNVYQEVERAEPGLILNLVNQVEKRLHQMGEPIQIQVSMETDFLGLKRSAEKTFEKTDPNFSYVTFMHLLQHYNYIQARDNSLYSLLQELVKTDYTLATTKNKLDRLLESSSKYRLRISHLADYLYSLPDSDISICAAELLFAVNELGNGESILVENVEIEAFCQAVGLNRDKIGDELDLTQLLKSNLGFLAGMPLESAGSSDLPSYVRSLIWNIAESQGKLENLYQYLDRGMLISLIDSDLHVKASFNLDNLKFCLDLLNRFYPNMKMGENTPAAVVDYEFTSPEGEDMDRIRQLTTSFRVSSGVPASHKVLRIFTVQAALKIHQTPQPKSVPGDSPLLNIVRHSRAVRTTHAPEPPDVLEQSEDQQRLQTIQKLRESLSKSLHQQFIQAFAQMVLEESPAILGDSDPETIDLNNEILLQSLQKINSLQFYTDLRSVTTDLATVCDFLFKLSDTGKVGQFFMENYDGLYTTLVNCPKVKLSDTNDLRKIAFAYDYFQKSPLVSVFLEEVFKKLAFSAENTESLLQ